MVQRASSGRPLARLTPPRGTSRSWVFRLETCIDSGLKVRTPRPGVHDKRPQLPLVDGSKLEPVMRR